jgi:TP901 family phage tail tape measure protein
MEQAGVQLIAQGASAFDADMKSATKATNDFVDGTEKGGGRVSAASQMMIGGLRELGSMATQAFVQAAKATAAFVGDSINLAGDFEAGMLNFQAIAGKDVDAKGLEQFRDLFLQIGKELPVSTADVQKAATEMIKGGIDPAIVAAGGLKQNIQFAAAAMDGDLVAAAEISAKILGGWTDAAATAQQKTDFLTMSTNLMTKAANASAVDVKGLSQGIFNAQGIAKVAGVGFEDLTTTLATLAPRFASSSEAGNSLKNMIARLQPTTDPATEAMAGLGLYTDAAGSAFYDAQGNFVGFQKAAQLLQDSLKGLTKEQQAATLQQIFGNDAMGSAAALADLGSAGYQAMADAMAKANGVAENAALKQQGFNTALDNAKGSVEALQITIGSALLPVLTDLFNNVLAPAVNTLTDMADALSGNEEAFARLSPAAQGVVDTIGVLVANVQEIIGAFNDAGAGSDAFATRIGDLANDLGLPGALISDLVTGIQDLIAAFSDGGAGADTLGGALDDLNGVWTLAGKVVADVMAGYEAVAKAVLPQIQQFIANHGEEISAFFKSTWDSIIQIVTLALQLYDSIVPPILQAIAGFISAHGEEIQKVLTGAWTIITSLITGTLDTIKGVIKLALDLIHGDWEAAWGDIKGIVDTQVTAIGGIVTGFLNIIAGIFNTSMADIKKTWENNWTSIKNFITTVDWAQAGSMVVAGIKAGVRAPGIAS